jgi:hypothetical protein
MGVFDIASAMADLPRLPSTFRGVPGHECRSSMLWIVCIATSVYRRCCKAQRPLYRDLVSTLAMYTSTDIYAGRSSSGRAEKQLLSRPVLALLEGDHDWQRGMECDNDDSEMRRDVTDETNACCGAWAGCRASLMVSMTWASADRARRRRSDGSSCRRNLKSSALVVVFSPAASVGYRTTPFEDLTLAYPPNRPNAQS